MNDIIWYDYIFWQNCFGREVAWLLFQRFPLKVWTWVIVFTHCVPVALVRMCKGICLRSWVKTRAKCSGTLLYVTRGALWKKFDDVFMISQLTGKGKWLWQLYGAIEAWEIQGLKEIPYRRSAMLYPQNVWSQWRYRFVFVGTRSFFVSYLLLKGCEINETN